MVLDDYRGPADKVLMPLARRMRGYDPNTVSWLSLICAALAGYSFYRGDEMFVLLGFTFVFLNGLFDAVDGKIARLTKKASKRGDFLDHVLDRYADFLIIGGIVIGPLADDTIGVVALIGVFLTSYMGTQAQAMGCGRDYKGILGRADRLVIIMIAALIQYWALTSGFVLTIRTIQYGLVSFSVFDVMLVWFALAGNYTAIQRGIATWKQLGKKAH